MKIRIFKGLKDKLDRLLGRGVVDEQLINELEECLLSADVSIFITEQILDELKKIIKTEKIEDPEQVRIKLKEIITDMLKDEQSQLIISDSPPTVYLILGVNGAGKTTTIAKLAQYFKSLGKKVLVAGADTFRAAAIEQLAIWAERVGADIVKGAPGGDPAAVVFDAITAAKSRGADIVLADTAGRQHTKTHLMNELEKVVRVSEKALGRKPDEILLILDGNTGQNAIRQAEEFSKISNITGVIVTKLDGTAKGGAVLSVRSQLGLPIKGIGVGEKQTDFKHFSAEEYAEELIG